jgi:hypothetical protein
VNDYHSKVQEFRSLLKNQLEIRIEGERIGHDEDLCLCTMMDPRFKNFDFKRGSGEMRDKAKKYLIDTYIANWAPKPEPKPVAPASRPANAPKPAQKLSRCFLDDTDDEDDVEEGNAYILTLFLTLFNIVNMLTYIILNLFLACNLKSIMYCVVGDDDDDDDFIDNEDSSSTSPVEVDSKEVDLYIAMPQVDHNSLRDDEVLDWWRLHKSMFPNLGKMARQFLALPASSAGVERLFSRSGETHGDKRKRMKEETLQSLMFVCKNG